MEISLEFLSSVASSLCEMPRESDPIEVLELKETLLSCSEINFYLHKIPELDKDGSSTAGYIVDTMNFFKKNKDIL